MVVVSAIGISQKGHAGIKCGLCGEGIRIRGIRVLAESVTMTEKAIGCVADGFVTCRGNIHRRGIFTVKVTNGSGFVSRPGIPHGYRCMEQIAGMHGWIGKRKPNGIEEFLVPHPGDGVGPYMARPNEKNNGRDSDGKGDWHGEISPQKKRPAYALTKPSQPNALGKMNPISASDTLLTRETSR